MLPSKNPLSHYSCEILAPFASALGQKCHFSKSINPLLTFFNFANLDFLILIVSIFKLFFYKHADNAAV